MTEEEATKELTICRHIPSSRQYVPADYIIIRESFPSRVRWKEAFEELMKQAEEMLASWPQKKDSCAEQNGTSDLLDAKQLESLPWKSYRDGKFDGWIFSNAKGAESLLQRLRKEKVVKVDGVSYRLSGPEQNPEMFIRRSRDGEAKQQLSATVNPKVRRN